MPYVRLTTYAVIALLALFFSGPATGQTAAEFNERGIASYNAKSFSEALGYFEEAYEKAPENEVIKHNLCNAHQEVASQLERENKTKDAIRHLELAIGIDPENPSPLVQVGSYFLQENQISNASVWKRPLRPSLDWPMPISCWVKPIIGTMTCHPPAFSGISYWKLNPTGPDCARSMTNFFARNR